MVEQPTFNPPANSEPILSIQDLLEEGQSDILSDYLSLSFSAHSAGTKICITTTDAKPTTFCTIIPATSKIDLQSLQFIASAKAPRL